MKVVPMSVLGLITVLSVAYGQEVRISWSAPPHAQAKQNPLAGRADILPGGQKVFEQRCSACHRADGTGTSRGPNLTVPRVQQQSDGALFWKMSSGNARTGMPSFSFLPESQRWQLVLHLRSLAD